MYLRYEIDAIDVKLIIVSKKVIKLDDKSNFKINLFSCSL